MPTHLHFIRHGQVAANRGYRLCGRSDPPLTAKGRRQALACADKIDQLPRVDAIYCSPLFRARQTAKLATSFVVGMPSAIIYDDRLLERDFGPLTSLSLLKLRKVWDYDYGFTKSLYGEETLLSMELRTESFLAMIRARHPDEHVLVFSHGGIGTAIDAILCEDHPRTGFYFKRLHIKNGEMINFLL